MTPLEVAFGTKPDLSFMHIFGEECFVLTTSQDNLGKLDARSKRGIFLGYEPGTKDTFKILCDNKIILSRNVKFMGTGKTTPQDNLAKKQKVEPAQNSFVENDDVQIDTNEIQQQLTTSENNTSSLEDTTITEENQSIPSIERRYPVRDRRKPQDFWVANVCLQEPQTNPRCTLMSSKR